MKIDTEDSRKGGDRGERQLLLAGCLTFRQMALGGDTRARLIRFGMSRVAAVRITPIREGAAGEGGNVVADAS